MTKLDTTKLEDTGRSAYHSGWRRVTDAEYFDFLVAKLLLLGAEKIIASSVEGYALIDATGVGVQQKRNTILNCQRRTIPPKGCNRLININHYETFINRVANGQT